MTPLPACPTCGQPAPAGEPFPFCSPRCKKVDLYRWVTGDIQLEEVEKPLPPPRPEGLEVEDEED